MISFLNVLFTLVGLIKVTVGVALTPTPPPLTQHEDKEFKTIEAVDGPLLVTVEYLSKKSYFSLKCQDILMALVTKWVEVCIRHNDGMYYYFADHVHHLNL